MLPVMETRKKIVGYTYRQKEIPFGTVVHIVFRHATVLYYINATIFVGIAH